MTQTAKGATSLGTPWQETWEKKKRKKIHLPEEKVAAQSD